jgi:hypothetical protein
MKFNTIQLIKDFFGNVSIEEMKCLTKQDRVELGSAIARQKKISPDQLDFEPVE